MLQADPDQRGTQPCGLAYWMERVLDECETAGREFAEGPVHDLRVSLRRCRTMADGFAALDPDERWKAIKKESKRLFSRLGALRDVQVMKEWGGHLSVHDDPVAATLIAALTQKELELKRESVRALEKFDRQKWRGWIRQLHPRARRVPFDGLIFQLMVLQAYNEAHELHRQALRNRSTVAYHRLRVGLKRFRYLVENFLPSRHAQWGPDLKDLQDCLGDVHDLSVLLATSLQIGAFPDAESLARWRAQIKTEQRDRIAHYRQKMVGIHSLWRVWREELPPPHRTKAGALAGAHKIASLWGADVDRARLVCRLAIQLHSGLKAKQPASAEESQNQRAVLHAAAILQEVMRTVLRKKGHSFISRLISRLTSLPGFSSESRLLTARILFCHDRKLQHLIGGELAQLPEEQRDLVIDLAGILRLAKALAQNPDKTIRITNVHQSPDAIVIFAQGFCESAAFAEKLARARYLLEHSRNQPVIIRALNTAKRSSPGPGQCC